jgi:hypothetical protein
LRQEPNFTSKGVRPPFAFTGLGHLHLRPSSLESRLVIIVVVLVIGLLLGKHGPRARLLLQSTRSDLDVRLLGAFILPFRERRPDRNVEIGPAPRGVIELQPISRLIHVDPLVVPIYVLDPVFPSSTVKASQHPFEPLLLQRPKHSNRTPYEFRVDGVRARIHRDDLARLVVDPDQSTVEIPPFHPLRTQFSARVAITITTRILR